MDDDWLGIREAARLAGLSYEPMLRAVQAQEVPAEYDGYRWRIDRSGLQAWIAGRQLAPGDLQQHFTLRSRRRSNVHLLEELLGRPGWSLERIAGHVGVKADKVAKWPRTGVPNAYVPLLRQALEG